MAQIGAPQLQLNVTRLHPTLMQSLEEPPRSPRPAASVLIVDDLAKWRTEVRKLLEKQSDWQVVAEACDGLQAIQRAAELSPDLVLLDIGMPYLNGLEAAAKILQISPRSAIVFLTQESDADIRSAALDTGARGYVLKANAASELLPTITAVLLNGHGTNMRAMPVLGQSWR